MSVEAFSWALKQQAITDPAARAVLFGLANHANHEGRHAFPSVDLLCRYTGLSPRTVKTKLRLLQDEGLIRKGNQKIAAAIIERADRRPVVYDLVLAVGLNEEVIGDEQAPFDESQQGAIDAPREPVRGAEAAPRDDNGVQMTTERGARPAPETSLTDNPSLSGAGDIFKRAQKFDDAGNPVLGASFPMTEDWEPEWLTVASLLAGTRMSQKAADDLLVQHGIEALEKFRTKYLAMPGRAYETRVWNRHLADYLATWQRNLARHTHLNKTTGGAHANGRQRTPSRRLTAAEARERDRQQREQPAGGQCFEGEWGPGH